MHGVLCFVAVQHCQVTAELYGVQDLIGVNAVTKKLVSSLDCRAALVTEWGLLSLHRQLGWSSLVSITCISLAAGRSDSAPFEVRA